MNGKFICASFGMDPLGSVGIRWDPLESVGIRWDPLESVGICCSVNGVSLSPSL